MARKRNTLTSGERLSVVSLNTIIAKSISIGHSNTLRYLEELREVREQLQEEGVIQQDGEFWTVLKDR